MKTNQFDMTLEQVAFEVFRAIIEDIISDYHGDGVIDEYLSDSKNGLYDGDSVIDEYLSNSENGLYDFLYGLNKHDLADIKQFIINLLTNAVVNARPDPNPSQPSIF